MTATGKAQLFTDGRYHLQASRQLDSNWNLQKLGLKDVPTWQEYLEKVSRPTSSIADLSFSFAITALCLRCLSYLTQPSYSIFHLFLFPCSCG